MRKMSVYACRYAFLRQPAKSIIYGLSQNPNHETPDPDKFKLQHDAYMNALIAMGLELKICSADERFPDGNFVEDTHLILNGNANEKILIELNPGAPSRAGEPESLREFLQQYPFAIRYAINKKYKIDGGDILQDQQKLYVGLSQRTEEKAISELTYIGKQHGYSVEPVPVPEGLHLKSGMTCILPGHFIGAPSFEPILRRLQAADYTLRYFIIPPEENFAANVLPINGKIMIPTDCPKTKAYISQYYALEDILEVDTSQARLVDGALTCSSLVI